MLSFIIKRLAGLIPLLESCKFCKFAVFVICNNTENFFSYQICRHIYGLLPHQMSYSQLQWFVSSCCEIAMLYSFTSYSTNDCNKKHLFFSYYYPKFQVAALNVLTFEAHITSIFILLTVGQTTASQ